MSSIIRTIRQSLFLRIFLVMIPLGLAVMPLAASAATAPNIWTNPPGFWGPIVSCTGNYLPGATNSCTSLNDLFQTIINVIYFVMSAAIFIIAPILFIVGAIMIMMGGANPGMLTRGRQTMVGTAIGLAIVLCSYLIVNTVISVFHITGIGGFGGGS